MRVPVSAVLFDMDGVLVNSKAVIERVLHRWAALRGLDASVVTGLPHGQKTSDTIRNVAPQLNVRDEVAWLDAEEERDLDGIVEICGAAKLTGALAPNEWALVTSAGRDLAAMRLNAARVPLPVTIVSGESVKRGKPDPEGYLLGARLLGRNPEDCVVLEDAPAGIAAGIAAGMRVIGVASTHDRARLAPLGCITTVNDLTGISVERNGQELSLVLPSLD
jgi:mannitol-1-/sugar-/sorbitol-6-phosphatase